jgi:short-subunit dehydrogenase
MAFLQDIAQVATLCVSVPLLIIFAILEKIYSLFRKRNRVNLPPPKTVLITGASSGIGKELALSFAKSDTTIIITGRNKERMAEVQSLCEKKGAKVITKCVDVRDAEAMKSFINEVDRQSKLDLVIANAGVGEGQIGYDKNIEERYRGVVETNVNGVLNTVLPAATKFQARRSGHIVIISSLSALSPMLVGVYGCTKSCVANIGALLRVKLEKYNVRVNIVTPGWIETPLAHAVNGTITDGTKVGFFTTEQAVNLIRNGLERDEPFIKFPWLTGAFVYGIGVLPFSLQEALLRIQEGV